MSRPRLHPIPDRLTPHGHLHGGRPRAARTPRRPGPRLLQPPALPAGARPRGALGRGQAPGPSRRRCPDRRRHDPRQALRRQDRDGRLALVGQAPRRGQGDQPGQPGLERRRPPHPLRLSALRQGPRRPDQERPLPCHAGDGRGAGLPPSVPAVRPMVCEPGGPQGGARAGLDLADAIEGQPQRQPRRLRPAAGLRGGGHGRRVGGPSRGLRSHPGLPDRRQRRRHGILGDQRPGHGRVGAAGPGRADLGDRRGPPWPEAILRRRALTGEGPYGAAEPHRPGDPGVAAAGVASLQRRGQLGRGQGPDRPRGGAEIRRSTYVRPTRQCVTTIRIQAAEAREVVHGAAPPVRSSRLRASCVTPR